MLDVAKVPPHNLDAEQCVLAAGLIDKDALLAVIDAGVTPGMFYRDHHRLVFETEL